MVKIKSLSGKTYELLEKTCKETEVSYHFRMEGYLDGIALLYKKDGQQGRQLEKMCRKNEDAMIASMRQRGMDILYDEENGLWGYAIPHFRKVE